MTRGLIVLALGTLSAGLAACGAALVETGRPVLSGFAWTLALFGFGVALWFEDAAAYGGEP